MRRRALLATTAAAATATATAGCLAGVRRTVSEPPRPDAGDSHLHPADEPYLRDGLDATDDRGTWDVRLVTATPDDPLVTPAAEGRMSGFGTEGYDDRWAVVVERRLGPDDPVSIRTTPSRAAGWNGLRSASLPLVADSFDSADDAVGDVAELTVTARTWYQSSPIPDRARVAVFDEAAGDGGVPAWTTEVRASE